MPRFIDQSVPECSTTENKKQKSDKSGRVDASLGSYGKRMKSRQTSYKGTLTDSNEISQVSRFTRRTNVIGIIAVDG